MVRIGVTFAVIVLFGLAGCTSAAEKAAARFAQEKLKYEPNVGKEYWVTGSIFFCKDTTDIAGCALLRENTHLKIDDVVEGDFKAGTFNTAGDAYYRVVLDDGITGYTDASDFAAAVTENDPVAAAMAAAAECKRRGDPRIGMTAKQVEATCWGMPDHINTRKTAKGVREQFVYPNNRYVDLHNGIVTSIDIGGGRQRAAR